MHENEILLTVKDMIECLKEFDENLPLLIRAEYGIMEPYQPIILNGVRIRSILSKPRIVQEAVVICT